MSVATEFPPEVYIPAAARPRSLRIAPAGGSADGSERRAVSAWSATLLPGPAAPAAAALGAGVIDLDRWRHHYVGAQVGGRRRNVADLRIRPTTSTITVESAAAIRLTRRGLVALAAASVLIALAIVAIAWLCAPAAATAGGADGANGAAATASVVTVHGGDSLWAIAQRVAPQRDPRAEMADLRQVNQLTSDTLTPGQQLRIH